MELSRIATERRNERSAHIDELSTLDMLRLINDEDKRVAEAVEEVLPQVAEAVELAAEHLKAGGRLIYVGCGTSGRLGILDAVECPPTYSTEPDMVVGVIAGGERAIFKAVEGAEDDPGLGEADLRALNLRETDLVVGIAASGRTPYVIGAMQYAKRIGCRTAAITCCPGSEIDRLADVGISPTPGPEVVTGSTRMKSGTAQKMILNMISTGAMIRLGKVYGNLMVDVKPSNRKLRERCVSIVRSATGAGDGEAKAALEACGCRPKIAIVMIRGGLSAEEAAAALDRAGGRVSEALAGLDGGLDGA